MDLYHTTDLDGISIVNPDTDAMREVLTQLDSPAAEDADHPDVALVHDPSAWSISVYPNGTVTLENLAADDEPQYMHTISRPAALQLWQQLAQGQIEALQNQPWTPAGNTR